MNLQIIAGQPIKFWVAMEDESDPPIFQAADSTPTLQTLRKNGSSVTPGGGELVIGSVDSPNGYYVTFTPATLPAVGDNYLFTIQYLVSSVTNLLEYEGVAVPAVSSGGDATLDNQEEIIALLATKVINNNSPVSRDGRHVDIIRGDAYNGTHHGKFRWTVDKDYTDGWVMHMRVYLADSGEEPEPIMEITGAAESATSIAAEALKDDTLWADLTDAEYNKRHVFEVAMVKDNESETIIPNGTCTLYRGRIASS